MDKSGMDLDGVKGLNRRRRAGAPHWRMLAASGVLLLAIGAVILLISKGSPSEITAKDHARSTAQTSEGDSSGESMTAYEAELSAWITAIISDAHSGHYFANDFEDTYSTAMEWSLVQGMGNMGVTYAASADNKLTDEMLTCMLSYVETTIRGRDAFPFDGTKVQPKATAHCTRLDIK
jgi:hypothetical protein